MFEDLPFMPATLLFQPHIRNAEKDALGIFHNWPKYNMKTKNITKKTKKDKQDISKEMSDLNIPQFLQHSYINGLPPPKITSLRKWQKDLIQLPEWRAGKSGIVLVPTSGGKTVAADIAIAQLLEKEPDSKALYALPFVSLASEKTAEFKARFYKHSVRPYYQNVGGSDFRRGHIAVCTFEKAHALMNAAIRDGYINKFKLIIIDEIHMLNEDQRGAVIESLIMKCLILANKYNIRVIGLTATLNVEDAQRIAGWLNGFCFISDSRPTRIKHYFKDFNGYLHLIEKGKSTQIAKMKSIPSDKRQILSPIRSLISKRRSSTVLVFVNSRKQTISLATYIAAHLYDNCPFLPKIDPPNEFLISDREQIVQRLSKTDTGLDEVLSRCIRAGVGYHHAGMLLEERKIIEEAAKNSTISVIVATTTLSAGINICSVGRVIIYEAYRYTAEDHHKLIPASLFTQMAGRAGRDSIQSGDVVILGEQPKESELEDAIALASKSLEDITPHILDKGVIDRFFLQSLSNGIVPPTKEGAQMFVEKSLQHFIDPTFDIQPIINDLILRLQSYELIDSEMKTTKIGKAIAESAMSIEEGLELKNVIKKVENGLSLQDDIHMLTLCIPPSAIKNEKTPDYDSPIWESLIKIHEKVVKMITGIDSNLFQRHMIRTQILGGKSKNLEMKEIDKELDVIYFACLLQDLINEEPLGKIVDKYKVSRGSVQQIQQTSANFAMQTAKFCERIGCPLLGTALVAFKKRLDFGVQSDILPLLKLPSCTKAIARSLLHEHIKTPADITEITSDKLARIISKKSIPTEEEENLAIMIKDEAAEVTKSLAFLDTLEEYAIQNMMVESSGINII